MRINSLTVNNFLGLRHLALPTLGAITLIVGPNGAGKSSLHDAVVYALTGAPARGVRLKSDFRDMLSEGAEDGSVAIDYTQEGVNHPVHVVRNVRSGNCATSGPNLPAAAEYVLTAPRFAALDVTARRRFLNDLTGTQTDPDAVVKRLAAEGVTAAHCGDLKTMLRSGFDAAAKYAAERATECRGEWKGISGEAYGSRKAETWAPQAATATAVDAGPQEHIVQGAREAVTLIERQIGAATAKAPPVLTADQQKAIDALDERRAKLEKGEAELAEMQDDLRDLEVSASQTGFRAQCPCCEGWLWVDGAKLTPHVDGGPSAIDASAKLAGLRGKIAAHQRGIEDLRARINQGETAKAITDQAAAAPPVDLAPLQAKLAAAQRKVNDEQAALDTMRASNKLITDSEARAKCARKAHDGVVSWEKAKELLSPDGIPAQLLALQIGPLNKVADELCTECGFGLIAISPGMDIEYGRRSYAMCSESERWRADAVLAATLAIVSGVNLVLLDRFDVLDLDGRGKALTLFDVLAERGVQVIATGTLKESPKLDGIDVRWIESGSIKEPVAAKKAA